MEVVNLVRDEHLARGNGAVIGRQIVLPISRAFEIAWKSIKLRIWRSLITMSGIVLAIAFLMSVWVNSAVVGALNQVSEEEAELYNAVQEALRKQAVAQEDIEIRVGVLGVQAPPGEASPRNKVRDSLLGKKDLGAYMLPAQPKAFQVRIAPVSENERLDALVVTALPASLAVPGTAKGVEQFVLAGGTLVLIGSDERALEVLAGLLPARAIGGLVTGSEVSASRHNAVAKARWDDHPEMSYLKTQGTQGAKALAELQGQGIVWMAERGEGAVFWYPVSGAIEADGPLLGWITERGLLGGSLRWGARDKFSGGTAAKRDLWLVSLSLLVCIVGITNAMLMSVTERFREIGTMKCLGALDKFIVRLFLIESSLMGLAGSVIGVALGFLLAFVRVVFSYHVTYNGESYWLATRCFPGMTILMWILVSLGIGVVLSIIAAIYPAYRAARMQPVEAMRVEA